MADSTEYPIPIKSPWSIGKFLQGLFCATLLLLSSTFGSIFYNPPLLPLLVVMPGAYRMAVDTLLASWLAYCVVSGVRAACPNNLEGEGDLRGMVSLQCCTMFKVCSPGCHGHE